MQSIQVLQLSSTGLLAYIKELAKENPLIEEIDDHYDFAYVHSPSSEQFEIGEVNAASLTMYDRLKKQMFTLNIPEELNPVVEYGIYSINENGYLETDLESWAENCHTSIDMVALALNFIQSLEPAGIGARNLAECILLQLKQMGHQELFLKDLLKSHMEWIAGQNSSDIADKYQLTEEQANEIIDHIKLCHPKPGQLLSEEKTEHVIPEASIFKENGLWKLSFYKWSAPTIKVDTTYKQTMDTLDKETFNYLQEKYKQIDCLNQAIRYRTSTLELVIKKIIEHQYKFFENGPHTLKMLTLQQLADELDLHVSTISRTISNKYVQTIYGVLPIKFFLQSGVKQENGQQTAAYVVKKLIAQIIDSEDKYKPLSDDAIRKKLKTEKRIEVARRTVMKYRKQLNIPSSIKRKNGRDLC